MSGSAPQLTATNGPSRRGLRAVDGARHEFLAGAGLALDQDVLSLSAMRGRTSSNAAHGRAAAHEVADLEPALDLLAQLLDEAQVAEGLGAADDRAALVAQQGGRDADRDAPARRR